MKGKSFTFMITVLDDDASESEGDPLRADRERAWVDIAVYAVSVDMADCRASAVETRSAMLSLGTAVSGTP